MSDRWDIQRFATIDSTNTWVLEQARNGASEGLVAVADEQTAGRGRLGRSWIAPPGSSLLTSVLLRPNGLAPDRLHLATAAVALSGADAVSEVASFEPHLKWPNDLLVDTRKLAGVLTEIEGDALVVGIGINCTWPDELPPEIAEIAIAANHVAGQPVATRDVLEALLRHLERRLDAGWDAVAQEYRSRCATVGKEVRVELSGESFTGTATDIEDDGALIVTTDTGPRRVVAGDLIHLR